MQSKKKNLIKVLLVVLLLVAAGVIYSCTAGRKSPEKTQVVQEESTVETESEPQTESRMICVHVCGSVEEPGVYYLPQGSRVHEAVELAGGLSEDADSQYVNLAKEAEDGSQIYIPSLKEVEQGQIGEPEGSREEADDGLVNINTATVEELKSLPGIGEVKAKAILSYRERVGTFSSIEDIMNVAGIKANSFEQIRDLIKV